MLPQIGNMKLIKNIPKSSKTRGKIYKYLNLNNNFNNKTINNKTEQILNF